MPAYSVLAASSDPNVLKMIKAALADEDLAAIFCGDGEEALESAWSLKSPPQPPLRLIVLEACLPKSDGFEVLHKLSEDVELGKIPSLMLIDPQQNPASLKASVRLSADDYLQKPFDMKELRSKIHSMTKHFRAHASPHPVTGLPGHPELEQHVLSRLVQGEAFELVSFDINHFRPFNDRYGAEKGNEVIRMVVQLIHNVLQSAGLPASNSVTLNHIDGDDFIIALPKGQGDPIRAGLREKFQSEVQKFYSKEEILKGFIFQKDRENKDQIFPLMQLATAVLGVFKEKFSHYGALVTEINEALHQSKVGSRDA